MAWDLPRSAWGAGPHRAGRIATPVSRLFLHHAVTPQWLGVQAARNLQRIARGRGFIDISYSGLVDRQGTTIEGRGWGRSGAHTRGFNSTAHALCLVGNFESHVVPDGMIRGMARAVRDHRRVGPGRITHWHRQVAQTTCPGRHGIAAVPVINAAATGTLPPKEDDMPTKAQFQAWMNEVLDTPSDKLGIRTAVRFGVNDAVKGTDHRNNPQSHSQTAIKNRLDTILVALRGLDTDVDEATIAALVLSGLTPQIIAAAIPSELKLEVAGELTATAE